MINNQSSTKKQLSSISSNSSSIDEFEFLLGDSDLSGTILQYRQNTDSPSYNAELGYLKSLNYNSISSSSSVKTLEKIPFIKQNNSYNSEKSNKQSNYDENNKTNIFNSKYNDVGISFDFTNFDMIANNDEFELLNNDFGNSNMFDNI